MQTVTAIDMPAMGARAREASRALARAAPEGEGVRVLGPAPAPLAVLRGRHRRRLLMIAGRDVSVSRRVAAWLDAVRLPNAVRVQVDVDPYTFL